MEATHTDVRGRRLQYVEPHKFGTSAGLFIDLDAWAPTRVICPFSFVTPYVQSQYRETRQHGIKIS